MPHTKKKDSLLNSDREQYAEGKDVEMPLDQKWEKAYNQYLSLPKDVKKQKHKVMEILQNFKWLY